MASTILAQTIVKGYTQQTAKPSVLSRFFTWCNNQAENRLLWLGVILFAHGCILTPITILAVVLAGVNIGLFVAAISAMAMTLVTNLAAMPTKVTIPIFLLSILIDLGIIIVCAGIGFNASPAF